MLLASNCFKNSIQPNFLEKKCGYTNNSPLNFTFDDNGPSLTLQLDSLWSNFDRRSNVRETRRSGWSFRISNAFGLRIAAAKNLIITNDETARRWTPERAVILIFKVFFFWKRTTHNYEFQPHSLNRKAVVWLNEGSLLNLLSHVQRAFENTPVSCFCFFQEKPQQLLLLDPLHSFFVLCRSEKNTFSAIIFEKYNDLPYPLQVLMLWSDTFYHKSSIFRKAFCQKAIALGIMYFHLWIRKKKLNFPHIVWNYSLALQDAIDVKRTEHRSNTIRLSHKFNQRSRNWSQLDFWKCFNNSHKWCCQWLNVPSEKEKIEKWPAI